MFSGMVLAAGFGSRLRPLTEEIPKPLLPVGDQPLLVSLLRELKAAGATHLALNVHHLSYQISTIIDSLPFNVHVSLEPMILGTAGGIRGARKWLRSDLCVVVNGDYCGSIPVARLLEAPLREDTVLAVSEGLAGQGTVGLDVGGNVVRLRGECFGTEVRSVDYMGVARLTRGAVARLPEEGCLIGDWVLPQLRAGATIPTVLVSEGFIDIGTPSGYLAANLKWLRERGSSSFVAENATVSGDVRLDRVVVGASARIEGTGVIEESVVLPGARVRAPLWRSIVLPSGRVVEVG